MISLRVETWIRAGWFVMLLASLVLLALSVPAYLKLPEMVGQVQDSGGPMVTLRVGAALAGVIFPVATTLLSISLAVLIYVRKLSEPMAVFFSFYLLAYALTMTGPLEAAIAYWLPNQVDLAIALQAIYFPIFNVILLLVFPNGKFQPRWTRFLVVVAIFLSVVGSFMERSELARPSNLGTILYLLVSYGILFLAFFFQIYRYRLVYSYAEKQQTKWAVFGIIVWFVFIGMASIPFYYLIYLPPGTPAPWWEPLSGAFWFLGLSILPLGFAIAILRSRLWEIDLLIRRTLQYSVLTGLMAIIYFGSVVLGQRLVGTLTGEPDSPLVLVVSTLLIAALFSPLRLRVQDFIDRRFYRRKYDALQTLAAFTQTARDETNLEALVPSLLGAVQDSLEPEQAWLWLKKKR